VSLIPNLLSSKTQRVCGRSKDSRAGQRPRPLLIALTGWGQDEDRRRSQETGFDAHLVKPVDIGVLALLVAVLGAGKQNMRG
jgi:CheY-like chemotaxis protein